MNKFKSLFILSVPRSGSTALEQACFIGLRPLRFTKHTEILNSSYNKDIRTPQYAKKEKPYRILRKVCEQHKTNKIVRDVVQPFFVTEHAEWLKSMFNIILLIRPVPEIMVSRKQLGWKMPRKAVVLYQSMLMDIPRDESVQELDYYDFIRDNPSRIVQILQRWYPCSPFNYIDKHFLNKRKRTFIVLQQNKVKIPLPKKKKENS